MSPSGPAVVLLHGQPATAATWLPVRRRLPGLRVLAPDRPGYGHSLLPATDYPGNVAWLIRLLDDQQVDRAVLVGHSWGAGVATLAAARHRDRVAGLALVAPVGPHCVLTIDRALGAPALGELLTYAMYRAGGRMVRLHRARVFARCLDPADLPAARAELAAQSRRPLWRSFLTEQRALLRQLPLLAVAASTVDCPTRILAGTRDPLISGRTVRALAERLPQARVDWLNVGHDLPLRAPGPVASAIWKLAG